MKRVQKATSSPPLKTGIGLRAPHVAEILATRPAIGWLEVHSENYIGSGPALRQLTAIRRNYDVSLHGVGLSLGSAEGIDPAHLARLRNLVERIEPVLVSDHLSWSISGGTYLNDLLPLPYTEESLDLVCCNVAQVQERLGRQLLVENPSSYLRYRHSSIPEPEFLSALALRSGCGILCDVNNIYVTSRNFGLDAEVYLAALPAPSVHEIHLAGHARSEREGHIVLIDDHGSPVIPPVWELYRHALERFGSVPSLIEWDTNLPALDILLNEATKADRHREEVCDDVLV